MAILKFKRKYENIDRFENEEIELNKSNPIVQFWGGKVSKIGSSTMSETVFNVIEDSIKFIEFFIWHFKYHQNKVLSILNTLITIWIT